MLTKLEMPRQIIDLNTLSLTVATEWVSKIDDLIIGQMFEKYKDTEVSQVILIDETEFRHFLKTMLPLWKEMTVK